MTDVFISYSRKDKEFVERLVQALKEKGRDVWIDFEDIPFATDWWEEIQGGIEASESTVFVISPDSLTSQVCGLEVNYALKNNKRLIPLLYREPEDKQAPPEIAAINWVIFKTSDEFDKAVLQLLETFDTDVDAMRQHTRLLVRAREWEKKGHSPSLLLRGEELDELEKMLNRPDLTDLQRAFLSASSQRQRQVQIFWRFALGFLGGFLGMGFWAFSVFNDVMLITPLRLIYTISLGEVFGLFIGLLAVLADELPLRVRRIVPPPLLLFLRISACLVLGIAAWWVFRWFYQYYVVTSQDVNAIVFAGVGLATGFIVKILTKLPGWLIALITAVSIYIPMYVTFERFFAGTNQFEPLIYFGNYNQIYSVGIPIVIFIALGANAQAIRKEISTLFRARKANQEAVKTA
jgi:hypothetical protein